MTDRITTHLRTWLGTWPPKTTGITVKSHPRRQRPAWDGRVRHFAAVSDGDGTVVSVAPTRVNAVLQVLRQEQDLLRAGPDIADALELTGRVMDLGVMRWTTAPASLEPLGRWVPRDDPRLPEWLQPFNGDVLVAFDGDTYLAGAGRKKHDTAGHEIAVGTDPAVRSRGLATRLTATAAHRIVSDGAVATYLHDPDNLASARVADAAGFPDRGWSVFALVPPAVDDNRRGKSDSHHETSERSTP